MANLIGVIGESGSGKTTSLRNLDPATTIYIDADKKGLAWKGWKKQFVEGKNYFKQDFSSNVKRILEFVNDGEKYKDVQNVVIDTMNGIMVNEEIIAMKGKNYDKWLDLATNIWDIIDYALQMRDGVNVIMLFHSETVSDDNGYLFTRIKTSGRKLQKLQPETKLPIVLLAEHTADDKYGFWTRKPGSVTKTPMGMFDDAFIENDMVKVIKEVEEY